MRISGQLMAIQWAGFSDDHLLKGHRPRGSRAGRAKQGSGKWRRPLGSGGVAAREDCRGWLASLTDKPGRAAAGPALFGKFACFHCFSLTGAFQ